MDNADEELSSFLCNNKNAFPPISKNCGFSLKENCWISEEKLKRFTKKEKEYIKYVYFIVKKATSSMSCCRICGEKIMKKEIRIGFPINDPRGDFGIINFWMHPKCNKSYFNFFLKSMNISLADYANVSLCEENEMLKEENIKLTNEVVEEEKLDKESNNYAKDTKENECIASSFSPLNDFISEVTTSSTDDSCKQKNEIIEVEEQEENTKKQGLIKSDEERKDVKEEKSSGVEKEEKYSKCDDERHRKDEEENKSKNEKEEYNQTEKKEVKKEKDEDEWQNWMDEEDVDQSVGESKGKNQEKEKQQDYMTLKEKTKKKNFNLLIDWQRLCYGMEELNEEEKEKLLFEMLSNEDEEEIFDEDKINDLVKASYSVRRKPPDEILVPLLPFQEEGLAWMCEKEESEVKGGILADEMGMGKTIQMISLLVARPCNLRVDLSSSLEIDGQSNPSRRSVKNKRAVALNLSKDVDSLKAGNLIIAPLAAIVQWKTEIERFVLPNTLSVVIYHGQFRKCILTELCKYDVVITSYATVESEYRKMVNTLKIPCKYCGKMFLKEKLVFHQRYFCGPEAEKTARQNLTRKKFKSAAKKALTKLKLTSDSNFIPTPSNVFREIMTKANRQDELDVAGKIVEFCNPHLAFVRKMKKKGKINESDVDTGEDDVNDENSCINEIKDVDEDFSEISVKEVKNKRTKRLKENSEANRSDDDEKKKKIKNDETKQDMPFKEVASMLQTKRKNLKEDKGTMDISIEEKEVNRNEKEKKAKNSKKEKNKKKRNNVKTKTSNDLVSCYFSNSNEEIKKSSELEEKEEENQITNNWKNSGKDLKRKVEALRYRQKFNLSKTAIEKLRVSEIRKYVHECKLKEEGNKKDLIKRLVDFLFFESVPQTLEDAQKDKKNEFKIEDEEKEKTLSMLSGDLCDTKTVKSNVKIKKERENDTFSSPKTVLISSKSSKKTKNKKNAKKKSNYKQIVKRNFTQKGKENVASQRTCKEDDREKKTEIDDHDCLLKVENNNKIMKKNEEDSSLTFSKVKNLKSARNLKTKKVRQNKKCSQSDNMRTKKKKNNNYDYACKSNADESDVNSLSEDYSESYRCDSETNPSSSSYEEEDVCTTKIQSEDDKDEISQVLRNSILHKITWNRVILDEAHRIKGRTTSTAKAVLQLKASNSRWCLSGTPLQNRIGELYSLIRFLKFDPFAYYFCSKKGCKCKSLHFRFIDNKYCVKCNHIRMCHFSYFNQKIVKPIKNYGYKGKGKIAMKALKNDVLDRILLRRTKLERAEDIKLPPLIVRIRRDKLTADEQDFYESLFKQTKLQFSTYVEAGTILHNYAHIFDLLSRLRQAVDHPYLVLYGKNNRNIFNQDLNIKFVTAHKCGLCLDDITSTELVKSKCHHVFHKLCIKEYIESIPTEDTEISEKVDLGCPVCYVPLTIDFLSQDESKQHKTIKSKRKQTEEDDNLEKEKSDYEDLDAEKVKIDIDSQECTYKDSANRSIMSHISATSFTSSTKIEALVDELRKIEEKNLKEKSIIFSQYTTMLDIIEWRLKKGGFSCAKLTGSMPLAARTNILYAFNKDPLLQIVLISLKAGGEGLNLQVANNIFIMDPWWNPASEMQAIQRAHRIGQTKSVNAIRFICSDTVEERILQLQEKKQLVFDGTIGNNSTAITKLTTEDMRFLFQT